MYNYYSDNIRNYIKENVNKILEYTWFNDLPDGDLKYNLYDELMNYLINYIKTEIDKINISRGRFFAGKDETTLNEIIDSILSNCLLCILILRFLNT